MKAIMIMFDTLNRHMLPPYGCETVHAPNFERLAARTVTFDNCYAASMPCMPARRELHTGRYNMLHRSWGPIEPFDDSMPEILKNNGVYTHLVSDHQHYWEDGGATYHTRYSSWEFSRGQEGDPWKGHVADPEMPETLKQFKGDMFRQDWINRSYMPTEADQPQAQTFSKGLHFIQTNHSEDNWFLQIETFDPHEPFFSQQHYKDLYPHDYDGPHFDWPDYKRVTETPEQVEHMRNEYKALLSMCDHHLGRVLDMMDELDMWDDTLLIVCTDHGYLLGEHDWWAKTAQPWYNEIVHTPLFIWDPRSQTRNERRKSLVQTIDFAPTLLEFFGVQTPVDMQGVDLTDTVTTDQPIREAGLFGIHGGHVNVTDGRYVYMRAPKHPDNKPLNEYTLMPTHMRVRFAPSELQDIQLAEPFSFTKGCRTMQIEGRSFVNPHSFGTMLFDLSTDPGQEHPLVDDAMERRMIGLLVDLMHANDAPPEQFERLGLPVDGPVEDEHLLLATQHEQALKAMQPPSPSEEFDGESFSLHTPLKFLVAHDEAAAILEKHLPGFLGNPQVKQVESMPLQAIAAFVPAVFTSEILQAIADDFTILSGGEIPPAQTPHEEKATVDKEAILAIQDPAERIEALLSAMTLEEKVSLLAGASLWYTTPIERLGIPAIKVSDGPNGARGGGSFSGSVPSACFPVGIALAATWNPELIEEVGEALGEEVRTKGAQMILAPTVNIHRSPLNGRNFECYSEDPYLTARIAVAYINGVQNQNIGATIKHFVCNDSEFERHSISSEVDERAMREIYLPPFEAAVKEANTWAIMSAYNKVNGTYASENPDILTDILKKEWGFDGIVMSDWFGTRSTADSVNGGQDLEMPGPATWRGDKLLKAVEDGEVSETDINQAALRMLRVISRTGAFENPLDHTEQANDRPEHRAIIRRAGAEACVLLKNEGDILPLKPEALKRIAIIGPNAKTAQIMGGGSAQVNTHYAITPFEGITAKLDDNTEVGYEIGCTNHKTLQRLDAALVSPSDGSSEKGFASAFYNNPDLAGDPVLVGITGTSEQMWVNEVAPGINSESFSARFTAQFTAQESGLHSFGLSSAGLSRLFIDGEEVIDNWTEQTPGDSFLGMGSSEVLATVEIVAGQHYDLTVEYSNQGGSILAGVRLGHMSPVADDALERAVTLAAQSDVALVLVGLNGDWESEGHDRPDIDLVGRQGELVEKVAAANKNTVVVLQTGSPVAIPWLDKVAGLVQAWYPGQECGNAIADVLFGDHCPSGKLPQTFPQRLEDNPAFINYPGENGKVCYGEGIFVGYRYYEKKNIAPLFPFGFGLSYTTFAYRNLRFSADVLQPEDQLRITLDITNTGEYAGQEVVQLYIRDQASTVARPEKELKGFDKVHLEPGETKRVTFVIDRAALAYWDTAHQTWVAEEGTFDVLIGCSAQDIRVQSAFTLAETSTYGGPEPEPVFLGINNTFHDLMDNEESLAILEKHMPGFADNPQLGMVMQFSPSQLAQMAPEQFPEELVEAIATDLVVAFPS